MPLFNDSENRLSGGFGTSDKPSTASSSLQSSNKENSTPLTVHFSPARIDQRSKSLRVNEVAISERCSQVREAQERAEEEDEEGEKKPVGVAVTTAMEAMSLSTRRKRRHRSSDGSEETQMESERGSVDAGKGESVVAVEEAAVPTRIGRTLSQSKRTRRGRGRHSGNGATV